MTRPLQEMTCPLQNKGQKKRRLKKWGKGKRKSWFRPGGQESRQTNLSGRQVQEETEARKKGAEAHTMAEKQEHVEPVTPLQDPALQKVKPEEAQKAAAEVAKHIETTMEQPGNSSYQYPPVSLLEEGKVENLEGTQAELRRNQIQLEDTIQSFGIDAHMVNVVRGPSVTRYELGTGPGSQAEQAHQFGRRHSPFPRGVRGAYCTDPQ